MNNYNFFIFTVLILVTAGCEDAKLQVQDNPKNQYTDNKDGTITDNRSGLIWKKCVEGKSGDDCSLGKAKYVDWKEAGKLEHDGWRLPSINELQELVFCSNGVSNKEARIIDGQTYSIGCEGRLDTRFKKPTINPEYFPNSPLDANGTWSSTPYKRYNPYSHFVWYMTFYLGSTASANSIEYKKVRLVKGKPN